MGTTDRQSPRHCRLLVEQCSTSSLIFPHNELIESDQKHPVTQLVEHVGKVEIPATRPPLHQRQQQLAAIDGDSAVGDGSATPSAVPSRD